jgi:hypothetical protein
LHLAGAYTKEESKPRGPLKIELKLPTLPGLHVKTGSKRSFFFSYTATVRQLVRVVADLTGLPAEQILVLYRKWRLSEGEFLADIGYDGSAPIEVTRKIVHSDAVKCVFEDGTTVSVPVEDGEQMVYDLKEKLRAMLDIGYEERVEFIALGQVVPEADTINDAKLASLAKVSVYRAPIGDADAEECEPFKFEVGNGILEFEYSDTWTAGEAKKGLAAKLSKPAENLSVIDVTGQLALKDDDKVERFVSGRPFRVVLYDPAKDLTADQKAFLEKVTPKKVNAESRVKLFRDCGFDAVIYQSTLRKRFAAAAAAQKKPAATAPAAAPAAAPS